MGAAGRADVLSTEKSVRTPCWNEESCLVHDLFQIYLNKWSEQKQPPKLASYHSQVAPLTKSTTNGPLGSKLQEVSPPGGSQELRFQASPGEHGGVRITQVMPAHQAMDGLPIAKRDLGVIKEHRIVRPKT